MNKMNKKGQVTMGLAIVIAIMIFIVGLPVINIIKPEVTTARSSAGLDCSNSSISDATKLTCLGVDLVIPYFIWIIISLAGGFIVSRFLI